MTWNSTAEKIAVAAVYAAGYGTDKYEHNLTGVGNVVFEKSQPDFPV